MVCAGCVFVAGIHPSRAWTSGSFESMRWNLCMCAQTRPRFILSSERVLGGMEFEPMLTPREKSPLPENVPRGGSNPRRCGQRAQALPTELFGPRHVIWGDSSAIKFDRIFSSVGLGSSVSLTVISRMNLSTVFWFVLFCGLFYVIFLYLFRICVHSLICMYKTFLI